MKVEHLEPGMIVYEEVDVFNLEDGEEVDTKCVIVQGCEDGRPVLLSVNLHRAQFFRPNLRMTAFPVGGGIRYHTTQIEALRAGIESLGRETQERIESARKLLAKLEGEK